MITTIVVALITAVIGPVAVEWVKKKMEKKSLNTPMHDALETSTLIDSQLEDMMNELESQFRFVEKFIDAALNDGPSVKEILAGDNFRFPPFIWNVNEYLGWIQTKYPKERGEKKREFHDAA